MAMTSLNISLPEQLKAYVEAQVETGEYGTPSEYMRELIRQDRRCRMDALEQKLLQSLAGESISIQPYELEGRPLSEILREKLKASSTKKKR
jgi:antitoxin ParD1/3/4